MISSMTERLREHITQLRMSLLGYEYNYDREANKTIVTETFKALDGHLDDNDLDQRLMARAIAQYRAQLAMRPRFSIWLFEILSFVALLPYIAVARAKGAFVNPDPKRSSTAGVRLVFAKRWRSNPEIFSIPDEVKDDQIKTRLLVGHQLSGKDIGLIAKLAKRTVELRTPFPFQFVLKCVVDLGTVRNALSGLLPKFMLVYWEFSCSLSFITLAMQKSAVETYNVMHGDKFYYAKHAFFEVTRCYCWNNYYADLFKEEYARADFRIFQNKSFTLTGEEKEQRLSCEPRTIGIAAPHIATLARTKAQEAKAIQAFSSAVNKLAETHHVKIRPHPFYETEFEAFRAHLAPAICVESHEAATPRQFLIENEIIVGTVSTLLLEAAHIGSNVIVLETEVMTSVQSYHYLYQLENVHTATLATLLKIVASIDAKRELGQTNDY